METESTDELVIALYRKMSNDVDKLIAHLQENNSIVHILDYNHGMYLAKIANDTMYAMIEKSNGLWHMTLLNSAQLCTVLNEYVKKSYIRYNSIKHISAYNKTVDYLSAIAQIKAAQEDKIDAANSVLTVLESIS